MSTPGHKLIKYDYVWNTCGVKNNSYRRIKAPVVVGGERTL